MQKIRKIPIRCLVLVIFQKYIAWITVLVFIPTFQLLANEPSPEKLLEQMNTNLIVWYQAKKAGSSTKLAVNAITKNFKAILKIKNTQPETVSDEVYGNAMLAFYVVSKHEKFLKIAERYVARYLHTKQNQNFEKYAAKVGSVKQALSILQPLVYDEMARRIGMLRMNTEVPPLLKIALEADKNRTSPLLSERTKVIMKALRLALLAKHKVRLIQQFQRVDFKSYLDLIEQESDIITFEWLGNKHVNDKKQAFKEVHTNTSIYILLSGYIEKDYNNPRTQAILIQVDQNKEIEIYKR